MYDTLTNAMVNTFRLTIAFTGRCLLGALLGDVYLKPVWIDTDRTAITIPYGNTSKEEDFSLVSEYITNSLGLCQHLINTQLRKDFLTISQTKGFLLTILRRVQ